MEISNIYYNNIKKFLAPALAFTIATTFAGCNNENVKVDAELAAILNADDFSLCILDYNTKNVYVKKINDTLEKVIPSKVKYIDDNDITNIAYHTLNCNIVEDSTMQYLNLTIYKPNQYLLTDMAIMKLQSIIQAYNIESITFSNTDFKNDVTIDLVNELLNINDFHIKVLNIRNCENIDELENLDNKQFCSLTIANDRYSSNQKLNIKGFEQLNSLYLENNPSIEGISEISSLQNITLNDYLAETIKPSSIVFEEQSLFNEIINIKEKNCDLLNVYIRGIHLYNDMYVNNKNVNLTLEECSYPESKINIFIKQMYGIKIIYNGYLSQGEIEFTISGNELQTGEVMLDGEKAESIVVHNNTVNTVVSNKQTDDSKKLIKEN